MSNKEKRSKKMNPARCIDPASNGHNVYLHPNQGLDIIISYRPEDVSDFNSEVYSELMAYNVSINSHFLSMNHCQIDNDSKRAVTDKNVYIVYNIQQRYDLKSWSNTACVFLGEIHILRGGKDISVLVYLEPKNKKMRDSVVVIEPQTNLVGIRDTMQVVLYNDALSADWEYEFVPDISIDEEDVIKKTAEYQFSKSMDWTSLDNLSTDEIVSYSILDLDLNPFFKSDIAIHKKEVEEVLEHPYNTVETHIYFKKQHANFEDVRDQNLGSLYLTGMNQFGEINRSNQLSLYGSIYTNKSKENNINENAPFKNLFNNVNLASRYYYSDDTKSMLVNPLSKECIELSDASHYIEVWMAYPYLINHDVLDNVKWECSILNEGSEKSYKLVCNTMEMTGNKRFQVFKILTFLTRLSKETFYEIGTATFSYMYENANKEIITDERSIKVFFTNTNGSYKNNNNYRNIPQHKDSNINNNYYPYGNNYPYPHQNTNTHTNYTHQTIYKGAQGGKHATYVYPKTINSIKIEAVDAEDWTEGLKSVKLKSLPLSTFMTNNTINKNSNTTTTTVTTGSSSQLPKTDDKKDWMQAANVSPSKNTVKIINLGQSSKINIRCDQQLIIDLYSSHDVDMWSATITPIQTGGKVYLKQENTTSQRNSNSHTWDQTFTYVVNKELLKLTPGIHGLCVIVFTLGTTKTITKSLLVQLKTDDFIGYNDDTIDIDDKSDIDFGFKEDKPKITDMPTGMIMPHIYSSNVSVKDCLPHCNIMVNNWNNEDSIVFNVDDKISLFPPQMYQYSKMLEYKDRPVRWSVEIKDEPLDDTFYNGLMDGIKKQVNKEHPFILPVNQNVLPSGYSIEPIIKYNPDVKEIMYDLLSWKNKPSAGAYTHYIGCATFYSNEIKNKTIHNGIALLRSEKLVLKINMFLRYQNVLISRSEELGEEKLVIFAKGQNHLSPANNKLYNLKISGTKPVYIKIVDNNSAQLTMMPKWLKLVDRYDDMLGDSVFKFELNAEHVDENTDVGWISFKLLFDSNHSVMKYIMVSFDD